ncbi:MAG: hypothetical protein JXP34_00010 [Planctomycetes bacterium]|nr:hypothetical protein [Planctomycetota bacterium]
MGAMVLILTIALAAGGGESRAFRAGAAAIDITPAEFPVIVCGGFLEASASVARDRLFVRSIVLDDGAARIALAVVDSCVLPRDLLDCAKGLARDATGIPTDRILISATHTHSAPSAMACLGSDADEAYAALLPGWIAEAIGRAAKDLAPARAGWISVDAPDRTNCRRWILRPDRVRADPFGGRTVRAMMHPGYQNPDFIGPAGPIDPGLSLLALRRLDGTPIAVLANYSMHYFGASPVSADYYGRFSSKLASMIGDGGGPPFVAIMSQGTSGDLHWMDYSAPRKDIAIDAYAEALARIAFEAYGRIDFREDVSVAMAEKRFRLRRRTPDGRRLAWARRIVERMRGRKPANQEEVYAREQVLIAAEPETEVVLQAIRVGDLGIAAISCEVFGITGLKIKAMSPLPATFTMELANGEEGYIPPPEQHALGGYTTWPARTAGLEVGAEPKIVDGVLSLLERVSGKHRRAVREPRCPYESAIIASKPLAYYRLGEIEGLRAADASGNGNDALYGIGVALHLEGPDLNGCNNRAPHLAGGGVKATLDGMGPAYSVDLWFWNGLPADVRDVTGTIFCRPGGGGAAGDRLIIGGIRAARGRLVWIDPRGRAIEGRTEIPIRTWHRVAIVRDESHVEVFLDGGAAPEIAGESSMAESLGPEILVGTSGDPDSSFEGRVDEVAIYRGARIRKDGR